MIHVVASIKVKPSSLEDFIGIFKANVPLVLAEDGCLGYEPVMDLPTDMAVQAKEPNVVTVVEKWESVDALKAHLSSPHMLDYRGKTAAMVEDAKVRILSAV